jgi:EAL domain-containing protein (putative c-di-GMP-specific phosphodiesterase class I)
VPLKRDDQAIGLLSVCSRRRAAFCDHDVELLAGLAEFISTAIVAATELMAITARICGHGSALASPGPGEDESQLTNRFVASVLDPAGLERVDVRERIEQVLARREYAIAFQPIFEIHSGEMFAVEALARFDGKPYRPPDCWLADAYRSGLGVQLELELVSAALEQLPALPAGTVLAVNTGPEALASPDVVSALASAAPERVVVELTEHIAVEDYPALAEALADLREAGVRLAIDDAGAGYASLMHILRLAPDFIKLDRQLISGIDVDPVRRSLAASLMRFAAEAGATIIAEGVETASELGALDALGIHSAQGYHLARPVPLAELVRIGSRGSARLRRRRPPLRRASARRTVPSVSVRP